MMAEAGSSRDNEERSVPLKRKRSTSDEEDLENLPPTKKSPKDQEVVEEYVHNVIIESSPYTSESESPQNDNQPRSNFTDLEYNPDSFLSPPSLPELPNCVLSPLENVAARGESTPHSNKRKSKREHQSPVKRKCPLPSLSWADPDEVWQELCDNDVSDARYRHANMFDNHPELLPRMRAILLDWINEVCEVYHLHRETFHLTIDYLDRYLSNTEDVPKGRLQLIGITCLFIAAKIEEVYPPKISDFSFVTDGACAVDEIILQEVHILVILHWHITPFTLNDWLNIYMQLASEGRGAKRRLISETHGSVNDLRGYTFVFPQYSSLEYVICSQLMDLAVMHVEVNRYPYSVVAAAVMAHTYNKQLAERVSGYNWDVIEPCYKWLEPSARLIQSADTRPVVKGGGGDSDWGAGGLATICPDLNTDDAHRMQVHNVTLDMFDKVCEHHEEEPGSQSAEPELVYPPTPPDSKQKSQHSPSVATPSTRTVDP